MGQICGIDLCSELELEDGASRPQICPVSKILFKNALAYITPSHQLEGLGERCKLHSGVRVESPAAADF